MVLERVDYDYDYDYEHEHEHGHAHDAIDGIEAGSCGRLGAEAGLRMVTSHRQGFVALRVGTIGKGGNGYFG